jgi:hypothetical protein
MKASIDAEDTATRSLPTDEQSDKGQDDEVEVTLMSEKDRKKEVAKRAHEVKREKKKKDKKTEHAKETARKVAIKAGKKA